MVVQSQVFTSCCHLGLTNSPRLLPGFAPHDPRSLGLCMFLSGLVNGRAGLASQQWPRPDAFGSGPAALRPAPVCTAAAIFGHDGDYPHPASRLSHPLQLCGVCGALPCAAAWGEASIQAGTRLGKPQGRELQVYVGLELGIYLVTSGAVAKRGQIEGHI